LIGRTIIAVLVAAFLANAANAVIEFKITKSTEAKQLIAIVPFGWQHSGEPLPAGIAAIVADDLARSGLFEPIPFDSLPSRPFQHAQINFKDWRLLGPGNLVIGNVTPSLDGGYVVEFQLYDVLRSKQVVGFQLTASKQAMRRVAHKIADQIYKKLTGIPGAFDTKVAYVTEVRNADGEARYALSVADVDGHNERVILDSARPVMSPSWSPDGKKLAYVSFESDQPRIFIQEIATGERELIASFPGINGAPAFSPDGRRLAMTLSKDGNPEIYVMELQTRRLRRITRNVAIDTEPSWSPDGQSLVFTSDRGGKPQIYRTAVEEGRPERITFEGSYNARPVYSPDGTKLALVHRDEGRYRIGLLDLENGALQVLTESDLDESPSFAPNGSMILYATTDGAGSGLAAVSPDGRMQQRLAVQTGRVREPAWSPFRD
jgi:TolB protein